jgi:hypothetical protein
MAKYRVIKQGEIYKSERLIWTIFGINLWYSFQDPTIGGSSDKIFKTAEEAEKYILNHNNKEVVVKEIEL